jgi:hypothetical protein
MAMSDDFTRLKEQVENADRTIKQAAAQEKGELKAAVEKARESADDRAAALRAKSQDAADDVERQWQEVQADWDDHVKRIRARIAAKRAAHDAKVAERDAEWAEADAVDAIYYASAAIEEAQYAVLDAVLARKNADVTAAAV